MDELEEIVCEAGFLIFVKEVKKWDDFTSASATVYDLSSKRYIKRRSDLEIAWMKFCVGYRAKFLPLETNLSI